MVDERHLIFHCYDGSFLMSTSLHNENMFPSLYLDPYGIKLVIDEWSSFGDLQGIAFQHSMKWKYRNLIWEDGILHWRDTNFEHDDRHSPLVGWVMLMSKRLGSHLQIYDTGQQEARLHWLLLKEFGYHVTHSISRSMLVDGTWHNTCIIWQQVVWVHCVDMTLFMSIFMFSPHDLYDGGVRRQQELLLLWLLLGEYGLNLSHTLQDV